MRNNRGSAVAIILLLLGVSSLVGVALLSRSKLDTRISSAVTTYDQIFGAADGGSAIGVVDLKTYDRTFEYSKDQTEADIGPVVVTGKNGPLSDKALTKGGAPTKLTAQVQFSGFTTDPGSFAGWEVGEFYPEYWRGEGLGKGTPHFLQTNTTTSEVQSAVSKMKRKM